MSIATADRAAPAFDWKRWPETEAFVDGWIAAALEGNAFAADLAGRMARRDEHAVRRLGRSPGRRRRARAWPRRSRALGYVRQADAVRRRASPVFAPRGRDVPEARASCRARGRRCARSRSRSSRSPSSRGLTTWAWRSSATPLGPYRVGADRRAAATTLAVVERRGYLGFEPFPGELARTGRMAPHAARDALAARETLGGPAAAVRRRRRGVRRHRGDPRPGDRAGRARPTWPATWSSRSSATTGSRGTAPRRCRRPGRTGSGWAGRTTTTTRSAPRGGSSPG